MQNHRRAYALGLASSYIPNHTSSVEEQGKAMTLSTLSVEALPNGAKVENDCCTQPEDLSFGVPDTVYGLSAGEGKVENEGTQLEDLSFGEPDTVCGLSIGEGKGENDGTNVVVCTDPEYSPKDEECQESKVPYNSVDHDKHENRTCYSTKQQP